MAKTSVALQGTSNASAESKTAAGPAIVIISTHLYSADPQARIAAIRQGFPHRRSETCHSEWE